MSGIVARISINAFQCLVFLDGVETGGGGGFVVSRSDVPQLDAQDFEFGTVVAQRLVAEGGTGAGDALFEIVVEPEAVVAVAVDVSMGQDGKDRE